MVGRNVIVPVTRYDIHPSYNLPYPLRFPHPYPFVYPFPDPNRDPSKPAPGTPPNAELVFKGS